MIKTRFTELMGIDHPIALAGMLTVISPDYFNPMFHQTLGIVMLAIGGFSMAVGFALIQKIVKIEV